MSVADRVDQVLQAQYQYPHDGTDIIRTTWNAAIAQCRGAVAEALAEESPDGPTH